MTEDLYNYDSLQRDDIVALFNTLFTFSEAIHDA